MALALGTHLALVLELVEGPTLADRPTKGPVPLDEALPIARQIAVALALEPGSGIGTNQTNSPTITSPALMTGVGMLLGTAAYMSPEQA